MQILGLLGMSFDAVVVEFQTFLHFIQIGSGHTVIRKQYSGWVRPNPYVCLHSGWVGVARCLRNQKINEKIFSEKEHREN